MNVDFPTPVSPRSSTLISVAGSDDDDDGRFGGRCSGGEYGDETGGSNVKYKRVSNYFR